MRADEGEAHPGVQPAEEQPAVQQQLPHHQLVAEHLAGAPSGALLHAASPSHRDAAHHGGGAGSEARGRASGAPHGGGDGGVCGPDVLLLQEVPLPQDVLRVPEEGLLRPQVLLRGLPQQGGLRGQEEGPHGQHEGARQGLQLQEDQVRKEVLQVLRGRRQVQQVLRLRELLQHERGAQGHQEKAVRCQTLRNGARAQDRAVRQTTREHRVRDARLLKA